jgi:hypothetical protein
VKLETLLLVAMACLYLLMAVALACGCSFRISEEPCLAYARAIESRMTECKMLPDEWYQGQLQKIYDQCDAGPLGLTFVDGEDANECTSEVRAETCERLRRGAPSCLWQVQL